MSSFDQLNADDMRRLSTAYLKWVRARSEKKWRRADAIRTFLTQSGCFGDALDKWLPVFESSARRKRRLARRDGAVQ